MLIERTVADYVLRVMMVIQTLNRTGGVIDSDRTFKTKNHPDKRITSDEVDDPKRVDDLKLFWLLDGTENPPC